MEQQQQPRYTGADTVVLRGQVQSHPSSAA